MHLFKYEAYIIIYKFSVYLVGAHFFIHYKINQLMVFKKDNGVDSENHTKHLHKPYGKHTELCNVKIRGTVSNICPWNGYCRQELL
jgi:hypothetical protein